MVTRELRILNSTLVWFHCLFCRTLSEHFFGSRYPWIQSAAEAYSECVYSLP